MRGATGVIIAAALLAAGARAQEAVPAPLPSPPATATAEPPLPDEAASAEDEDTRIVGGTRAPARSVPWQAELYSTYTYTETDFAADSRKPFDQRSHLKAKPNWERVHRCGGAYIGEGWVLSAAHCFDGVEANPITDWRIRLGTQDIADPDAGETYAIDRVAIHRDFRNAEPYPFDIALVHIVADARTKKNPAAYYRPIRLLGPGDRPLAGFDTLRVTGWGRTKSRLASARGLARDGSINYGSAALLQIDIRQQGDACAKLPAYREVSAARTICAGDQVPGADLLDRTATTLALPRALLAGTVKDTCNGDSGGPLTVARGMERVLVGLVSWGRGCAIPGVPGIYTRVSAYAAWIAQAKARAPVGRVSRQ